MNFDEKDNNFDDLPFEEDFECAFVEDENIEELSIDELIENNISFIDVPTEANKTIDKNEVKEDENKKIEDKIIKPFENVEKNFYVPNDDELTTSTLNSNFELKQDNKIMEYLKNHLQTLPVIAFVFVLSLGIYLFSSNIKADSINLIRFEENEKVGYINYDGEVIAKAKYLSGTDFYKGFAVVKNYNSLSGIINGKAKLQVPFGTLYYIELHDDRYISSKITKDGLKQALLNENLKEVTRYIYDSISYTKSGLFLFVRDETMGIMNKEGKEVYTYVVDEVDDKNISIEVSESNKDDKYAKVKINTSSTIIDVNNGKEIYKYTASDLNVLDNNVFYIRSNDPDSYNTYLIVKNDKIIYQTSSYKRIRVEDIDSNIAIGIKENAKKDYIDLNTREIINNNENDDYAYSDGVVLVKSRNFSKDIDEYKIKNTSKILGEFDSIKPINNEFVNGFMKVYQDEKIGFMNKKGKIISKKSYEEASDFASYGYAVVSNDKQYGVISKNGNEVIKLNYDEITLLNEDIFNTIKIRTGEEVFIFRVNDKYGIINSKGKILIKPIYSSFDIITEKYPILQGQYNNEKILINMETFTDLTIKVKDDVYIYDNYIITDNKYYNYDGKLIYKIKEGK